MPAVGEIYIPWRLFSGSFIPNSVLKCRELSATSKLIFGRLSQFGGEHGNSYPSYSTLAQEVGIERRQAMRAVKELEAFGLIRLVGRLKDDGGFTSNAYEFLWHRIFCSDDPAAPGDKKDTRGGVTNVTTPRCHSRHHLVSEMTPKENHTRDKNIEKTTTEEIRLLLSGTPLSEISDKELNVLTKRHGIERLLEVCDIAAETWRRDRKEIRNPGGYIQTLCESHVVPEWYRSVAERNAKLTAVAERKLSETRRMEEQKAAEEREAEEQESYWISLSLEDRIKYRDEAKASSPFFQDLEDAHLEAIAKLNVWENRSQMSTNVTCGP